MYGPNTDSVNHFKILENCLKENDDKSFIIGGDFNTIIDTELDKKKMGELIHIDYAETNFQVLLMNLIW